MPDLLEQKIEKNITEGEIENIMRERELRTAKQFNIVDKVEKLEKELLEINGVTGVEFDLDGFYDNMHQVIFLTKYDIPVASENYFELRKQLLNDVIKVANNNGLMKTEDRIEDYGEHLYFVMKYGREW